jgi:DNA-binding IscR family transcriptional regulator
MELTRDQFTDLKELLTERIVDNMSTKDLVEYVMDDYFKYFDSLTYADFMTEAENYWDDHFPDILEEIKE